MKKASNEGWFTRKLLTWHNVENERIMPWKGEKDPYKIWLSEIILQQTRVEQGMAYYLKFILHYPTVQALAAAPDDDVFKLWEGLGYYSRCRNLLAAARTIVLEYNGNFPTNYTSILLLKGVGPYTASAIASFAYNLPHAVVDGNVNRVLSRFFGIKTAIDSSKGKQEFASLAASLLPPKKSGLYNQAIMDFGATICKPQLPVCDACCMQPQCEAYQKNLISQLPIKEKKLIKKERWFYYVMAQKKSQWLIQKRQSKDIWHQLHEFFLIETESLVDPNGILSSIYFTEVFPGTNKLVSISDSYRQQLTHQTIHAVFIKIQPSKVMVPYNHFWAEETAIRKLAFPRLINHYLQKEKEEGKSW